MESGVRIIRHCSLPSTQDPESLAEQRLPGLHPRCGMNEPRAGGPWERQLQPSARQGGAPGQRLSKQSLC